MSAPERLTWDCFMGQHHWCVGLVHAEDRPEDPLPCECRCHPRLW